MKIPKTTSDIRCAETRMTRLISGKVGEEDELKARIAPIHSLRNKPNSAGVLFQYGKRAGKSKPWKHKDCNDIT